MKTAIKNNKISQINSKHLTYYIIIPLSSLNVVGYHLMILDDSLRSAPHPTDYLSGDILFRGPQIYLRYHDIVQFLERYFDILRKVSLILRYQWHNLRQLSGYSDKMAIDIMIFYHLILQYYYIMTAYSGALYSVSVITVIYFKPLSLR